jgi:BatD DUF11 like domain
LRRGGFLALALAAALAAAAGSGRAARADGVEVVPAAGADGGAPTADRDAPTVTARADRTEAHVGDAITVVVTAIGRRTVPVNLPGTLELGDFALLDRKEAEQDLGDGRVRREFTLTVAAYEPGEREIPPLSITYLGKVGDVRTARTAPVPVHLKSLIANEPEPALKDNAPPVRVMQQDLLLAYIAGGLLAAAVGALVAALIVRRLRARAAARPGPPPRPAHEIALEKLDRLGQYGFLENADNRPFYFAVSEVIREYLGARFGFDSLELTTDELVAELRRQAGRGMGIHLGEVQGWLSACDLVKFAKTSPTAAEARGTLETAIRIVSSTRPRVEAPEGGAAPVSGGPPDAPGMEARHG